MDQKTEAPDLLRQWLKDNNLSQAQFSKRLPCDQWVLSRAVSGKTQISLAVAVAIERATSGFVPAASWVSEDALKSASA